MPWSWPAAASSRSHEGHYFLVKSFSMQSAVQLSTDLCCTRTGAPVDGNCQVKCRVPHCQRAMCRAFERQLACRVHSAQNILLNEPFHTCYSDSAMVILQCPESESAFWGRTAKNRHPCCTCRDQTLQSNSSWCNKAAQKMILMMLSWLAPWLDLLLAQLII